MSHMSNPNLEIGQRLKTERRLLNLSQQDVANLLGVTFQQVQKYENGKNRISLASSKILKRELGIDLMNAAAIQGDESINLDTAEIEILRTFRRIKNPAVKGVVLKLMKEYTTES